MKPVLIISDSKTVFHHTVATALIKVSCLVPGNTIDSNIVNTVDSWFQEKFKPFAESYIEAVATVETANLLLRDLVIAKSYYTSMANQGAIISSFSKAYNHQANYITKVIEAVESGIKAFLKTQGNTNPQFELIRTRVGAVSFNEVEPYNWKADEIIVSHAWYHNGTVATVPGDTTQPENPNNEIPGTTKPMQPKKGWFDRHYKKIMWATLAVSIFKK